MGLTIFLANFRPQITTDISNNKLTNIPESIGGLKKLEYFNLENTNIKKLPDSIGQLLNLKKLELLKIEKVQDIKIIIIPNDQLSLLDYKIYKLKLSQKNKYKDIIKNNNTKGKKITGINVKNDSHVSSIVKAIIKIIK